MKSIIFSVLLFSVLTLACKQDKEAPTLVITAPALGALIKGPVNITGSATDKELHEMTITITKDADASVLFTKVVSVHDLSSYNFNETFTPTNILISTEVTLTISVEDNTPNTTSLSVKFKLLP